MGGIEKALSFFKSSDSYILTTHEGPDADGVGAELVLAYVLMSLGKRVQIFNSAPIQERFAFLDPEFLIQVWDPPKHSSFLIDAAIAILDTSDELNLGSICEDPNFHSAKKFIVDHHEPPANLTIPCYIDQNSSSSCELAIEIAQGLKATIDLNAAKAAFAGIVYDTGSFIYPKTSAKTFRTALTLVELGVIPNEIHRAMNESFSVGSLLLQKKILSSLELHSDGAVAFQTMLKSDIVETGALYEDAEPLINIPLRSKSIEVSILLKESDDGRLRCSLRSKGKVNVSLIAQSFGGGGHRTASGFKCPKGLAETKVEVLKKVAVALETTDPGAR
ncbi:DHHA1 domain-containing protein [Treponema sp.]